MIKISISTSYNCMLIRLNVLYIKYSTKTYKDTAGKTVQSCIIFINVFILANLLLVETLKSLFCHRVLLALVQDLHGSFYKHEIIFARTRVLCTVENSNYTITSCAANLEKNDDAKFRGLQMIQCR